MIPFFVLLQAILCDPNYEYVNTILTISGSGSITKEGVQETGQQASIKEVIIKEGITQISDEAFVSCESLTKISIPSSVTTIGSSVFNLCKALARIIVADNNAKYSSDDQGALYDHDKQTLIRAPTIENFVIPDTVTTISSKCFGTGRNFNMKSITLPNSLTTLERNALNEGSFDSVMFSNSPSLESFNTYTCNWMRADNFMIPKSCTVIRFQAFICSNIKEFVFQEDSQLTQLESRAFDSVTQLNKITLPDTLKRIESEAFFKCSISYVYIGKSCNYIANDTFSMCSSLTGIEISEYNEMYASFNGLIMDVNKTTILFIPLGNKTITFPENLTSIGSTLLQSHDKLTSIILLNYDVWATENGVLYTKDYSTLVAVCGGVTDVSVHSNVKTIGEKALYGCKHISRFSFLGNSCETLKQYCFATSSITDICIPNSVTQIEDYAFHYCEALKNITITYDSQLKSIGQYCFRGTKISQLFIPQNITNISRNCFANTDKLETVTFHPDSEIISFDSSAFYESSIQKITIPSSLGIIQSSCFRKCSQLKEILFEDYSYLTTIQEYAFESCSSLQSINLPSQCDTVYSYAFANCPQLSSVSHSIKQIKANVFENDTSLISFNISSTTNDINPNAFIGCTNLIKFQLIEGNETYSENSGLLYNINGTELMVCPPGIENVMVLNQTKSINVNSFVVCKLLKEVSFITCEEIRDFGSNIFANCNSLKQVIFPPLIKTIGSNCFLGCENLKTIVFPASLQSIGTKAFSNCYSLSNVVYCGINIITGENIFSGCSKLSYISVTIQYSDSQFCSISAIPKLSNDCVFPNPFYNTCRTSSSLHCPIGMILIFLGTK